LLWAAFVTLVMPLLAWFVFVVLAIP
jgi:hypothetical protein